jgi:flagellar basal body-associated protein FliL
MSWQGRASNVRYEEQAMTDQNRPQESSEEKDRREQRLMWIFSGAIVVLILGAMGANMLFHKDSPAATGNIDISAQSRQVPAPPER